MDCSPQSVRNAKQKVIDDAIARKKCEDDVWVQQTKDTVVSMIVERYCMTTRSSFIDLASKCPSKEALNEIETFYKGLGWSQVTLVTLDHLKLVHEPLLTMESTS